MCQECDSLSTSVFPAQTGFSSLSLVDRTPRGHCPRRTARPWVSDTGVLGGARIDPVSADNVAIAKGSYEAFGRGDLDGALSMMDDDIEWHQAQGLPHGGVYSGLV